VLSIGKRRTLTPRVAETLEPISMKLEIYDYVRDPNLHDKFGGSSSTWVVWANRRFVTSLGFFSFFFYFLHPANKSHFLADVDDLYTNEAICHLKQNVKWIGSATTETIVKRRLLK